MKKPRKCHCAPVRLKDYLLIERDTSCCEASGHKWTTWLFDDSVPETKERECVRCGFYECFEVSERGEFPFHGNEYYPGAFHYVETSVVETAETLSVVTEEEQ